MQYRPQEHWLMRFITTKVQGSQIFRGRCSFFSSGQGILLEMGLRLVALYIVEYIAYETEAEEEMARYD
jgi:hypothetical protein